MKRPSALVLSLDFELHWGVRDHTPVAGYRANLLGVRDAVPALLALFERRQIACTWATVGMLMAGSKRELREAFPERLPAYRKPRLSPYRGLDDVGEDEADDPFHFAPSLVKRIVATPGQELATHTFSHYYLLEDGQSVADFDADIAAARRAAERFGVTLESIVFPRNQMHRGCLDVLRAHGITAYRTNGPHWAYVASERETAVRRAFRLADAYAPLSGARAVPWPEAASGLVDVGASAFLRPYDPRLRHLEPLRMRRLVSAMRAAARGGALFHLWWHPHNFGRHLAENLAFLEGLLDAFDGLRRAEGMESLAMRDVARRILPASAFQSALRSKYCKSMKSADASTSARAVGDSEG